MTDLNKTYLFRMTHIENIPHILQYGITHSNSANANPNFVPIGDGSLISTRNNILLSNGRLLGEYIPFYFGVRTPMLYVVQNGFNMVAPIPAENIVYCITSVQKIIDLQLDFVFTDGHAVDKFTSQFTTQDIDNLDNILDWKAIRTKYWRDDNDLDLKRRKEAEFLVSGDILINAILGYSVYNQNSKNKIINCGVDAANVHIKSEFYF
ncbi:hypothetical protein CHX27_05555 [Flavobacterium aurantiibacter]|uniref:DarT domain-containing protein n=2 Tax=Flavobacterium aurantiibacter TaxID=2023067 RepID=A0A255ZW56_9FLAO|nr:hypothetical protein CHX27_05555 [Flavobacterium aurantiibacter]